MSAPPIILASASPRRRKILREARIDCEIVSPEVDEIAFEHDPAGTALVNAWRKAKWARERYPGRVIIVADTVVSCGGVCLTKPDSMAEAKAMLQSLSGREHTVFTAVGVIDRRGVVRADVVGTHVRFGRLSAADIDEYFRRVDPIDKAGAYDIDQYGEFLVDRIDGSRSNVMGLPIERVREMLAECA